MLFGRHRPQDANVTVARALKYVVHPSYRKDVTFIRNARHYVRMAKTNVRLATDSL